MSPLNLNSNSISQAIEEYNEEHLALFPLKAANQHYFALMAVSKVEPGRYLDQANKKIYTVDHVKAEIVAVEDATVELVDSVEELLNHLTSDAAKYVEKYYKEPFGSHGISLTILSAHGPL